MTEDKQVCVIGGGMSGIAAAHFLLQMGYRVALYEQQPSLGGRAGVEPLAGKMVAMGGKNVGSEARLFRKFVEDNGESEFENFGFNWMREIDGKLVPVTRVGFFGALRSSLNIGVIDFLRFARFYSLVHRAGGRDDYLGNQDFIRISEKYDHKPISSYFGARFNEYFLRLMTVRMNGAEPEGYFLGNLCSNIGMIRLTSGGLDQLAGDGLHRVLTAFEKHERLTVHVSTTVEAVDFLAGEGVTVATVCRGQSAVARYDAVVMALPAGLSATLLRKDIPEVAAHLEKITYNPVGLAVVKYEKNVFGDTIKGVSFSPSDVLHNAGAYGLNDLDIVRYTFSGKAAMTTVNADSSPEELIENAEALLQKHCNISSNRRLAYTYRYYPKGLCAYAPFHHRVMAGAHQALEGRKVELTGDYLKGTSLEACFQASKEAVQRLHGKIGAQAHGA